MAFSLILPIIVTLQEIFHQLVKGLAATTAIEYVAVAAGITSVWFSRKENIWVYPTGLISTVIYMYLSFTYHLLGEAAVNFYYTIMSIYGWLLWAQKNKQHEHLVTIQYSTTKEWIFQVLFFVFCYIVIFTALVYLKKSFAEGAIPWADALASASAFTGMWLMAKKKIESWYWWVFTNTCSIPLYFVKGLVFTSIFYFVLLLMAFWGLAAWKKRVAQNSK